jgi:hypothetical protein
MPIHDQEVLNAPDDEQLAVGEEAGLPPKVCVAVVKRGLLGGLVGIRCDSGQSSYLFRTSGRFGALTREIRADMRAASG